MQHSEIINNLEERLSNLCDCILREKEYICNNKIHGEYDLAGLSISKDTLYVFEVKKTNSYKNRNKALSQLGKDYIHFKEQFMPHEKIKLFYAYSDNTKRRGYNVEEIK